MTDQPRVLRRLPVLLGLRPGRGLQRGEGPGPDARRRPRLPPRRAPDERRARAAGGAVQVDPAIAGLREDERHLREPLERRQRHHEQPHDALGRDVLAPLSEREAAGGGEGILHRASRAHRGHGAVRAHVAAHEVRPRSTSSRRSSATSPPRSAPRSTPWPCTSTATTRIERLTLAQADAAFSKTRKRGHAKDVATWGDLGLTGEWASRPLSLYGRNSASGTYGFFKEHVLKNGDYKDTVKEQPGRLRSCRASPTTATRWATAGSGTRPPASRSCPWPRSDGRRVLRGRVRGRGRRQVPAVPLPLPLRQPRPRASPSTPW